jgi:hypothetical protein
VTDYAGIVRSGEIPDEVRERALQEMRRVADRTSALRAVRHPLGFLCFPIERHHLGGICVHVWSPELPGAAPTTSEIHAHSWDLVSLVLHGELWNERVAIVDGEASYRVFEVHSDDDDRDELRATSRLVGCRVVTRDLSSRGSTYALEAGRFHQTIATEATTIAVGMSHRESHDLTLGPVDCGTHVVRRRQCDQQASVAAARIVTDQVRLRVEWT